MIRLVTIAGSPEAEVEVAAALASQEDVELYMRCVDRVELLAAVRGGCPDAVISVGLPEWMDRETVDEIGRGDIRFIALVADTSEGERAAALGASLLRLDASVDEVVTRCCVAERPALETLPRGAGQVAAVWGPKGSPGRTSLSIAVAAACADAGMDTLLVDCDAYGGDVDQLLGLQQDAGIVWASRAAAKGELSPTMLDAELAVVRERLRVLPGLPRPSVWADVSAFGVRELLKLARSMFRVTFCDVGFCVESDPHAPTDGRNATTIAAVDEADVVVAVVKAELTSLRQFLVALPDLRAVVDRDALRVVLNGGAHVRHARSLIESETGLRVAAVVPQAPHDFSTAADHARPVLDVTRDRRLRHAVVDLAASFGAPVEPRGLLSALGGRGRR